MKQRLSLRLRVTLVCGLLLTACCLLLTLTHNYYAYAMADAIAATPLQPAAMGREAPLPMEELTQAQITQPARQTFRLQSLIAMGVIVAAGCLMVYWLTGKALAPLQHLDRQIRDRTPADLDIPLPVPASGDEVARLTASFNQMSQNLSAAFARQKRFSQCAAHELRTPLAVLSTRMALFRKKGLCATPETAALLDVLEDQTRRLSDLVGDLLALSNMDALDCREQVDLSQILTRAADSLQTLARAHHITIRLSTEPCTVSASRTLLERAVFNLMENAVNYNRPGGMVHVRVLPQGDTVRIEVSDQGSGIPPQLREQIFEPFFRVDKSRSRQFGGAGLGLPLVRAVADLHQGRVWAEANAGGGSRFILLLPRSEAAAAPRQLT